MTSDTYPPIVLIKAVVVSKRTSDPEPVNYDICDTFVHTAMHLINGCLHTKNTTTKEVGFVPRSYPADIHWIM